MMTDNVVNGGIKLSAVRSPGSSLARAVASDDHIQSDCDRQAVRLPA